MENRITLKTIVTAGFDHGYSVAMGCKSKIAVVDGDPWIEQCRSDWEDAYHELRSEASLILFVSANAFGSEELDVKLIEKDLVEAIDRREDSGWCWEQFEEAVLLGIRAGAADRVEKMLACSIKVDNTAYDVDGKVCQKHRKPFEEHGYGCESCFQEQLEESVHK